MGEAIGFTWVDTTWGWMALAFSNLGLVGTTLPCSTKEEALGKVLTLWPYAYPQEDALKELKELLVRYFNGEKVDFNFPLDLRTGTDFQKKVWEEVRKVPWGQTSTYREIAERVGRPGASRAVGQALARNPMPIIIPCHRVIGSSGNLVGFSGGIELKGKLLALEGAIRL